VQLWDLRLKTRVPQVLPGHEDAVNDLTFDEDEATLASVSSDRTVRLWNLDKLRAAPRVLRSHEEIITWPRSAQMAECW
jgi:WD40 repeat protein